MLVLSLLLACTVPTTDGDLDHDGYNSGLDGDCNDDDASINPGATDLCDGQDQDCDGVATAALAWYPDGDDDGFGDASGTPVNACAAPDGYADDSDCDDNDDNVYPGAPEHCDDADEDCDNTVDNDAVDAVETFTDSDGDGFGDATTGVIACDSGTGLTDGTDCDDADPATHPAADETCDDIDNNCDGDVDEGFDSDVDTLADCLDTEECDDLDNDGDGDIDEGFDSDVDGTADCNDVELCDGLDNDGDGDTDEDDAADALIWYQDADTDSYGAGTPRTACEQPLDWVADATDCDDAVSATHPGADEYCNTIDDDCDGDTDEDDAVDAPIWYVDTDGDGYGEEATGVWECSAPAGTTAVGGDCDETDTAINPGATETCDGVDTNCSGDEGDAPGPRTYYADADGDAYGDPDNTLAGCSAYTPSGYVTNDGDCEDTLPDVNEGAAGEVCDNGVDDDCNGSPDACAFEGSFTADAYVYPGFVSGYGTGLAVGDVTGDGYPDAIVGSPYDTSVQARVYAGPLPVGSTYTATASFVAESTSDYTGSSVAADGDVDGDGNDDLLISAPSESEAGSSAGAAYLVYGGSLGASLDLSLADAKLVGEDVGDGLSFRYLGYSGSPSIGGDADGDGCDDVLVGAYLNDAGGVDAGAAYLVTLPGGTVDMVDATATFVGEVSGDQAGMTVAFIGDGNGDGYDDMAIGAGYATAGAGAAYIERGSATISGVSSLAAANAVWTGTEYFAGYGLAGVGDVTGDGVPELAVTGYGAGYYGDNAWLVSAASTGTASLADADVTFTDGGATSFAGNADFNDDGYTGLAFGLATETAQYLFYGPLAPDDYTTADRDATSAEVGMQVTTGDISGDGISNLVTFGSNTGWGTVVSYFGGGY